MITPNPTRADPLADAKAFLALHVANRPDVYPRAAEAVQLSGALGDVISAHVETHGVNGDTDGALTDGLAITLGWLMSLRPHDAEPWLAELVTRARVCHLDHVEPDEAEAGEDDADPICCFVCDAPFKAGDRYYPDEAGGFLHAECCGPEPESYTRNGEPLKPGDPIPEPAIWSDEP